MALDELQQETALLHQEMLASLRRLADLEERLTRERESLFLEIAMEAASRFTRSRVEADDPVALRAFREAWASLSSSGSVRVRLHPKDLERFSTELSAEVNSGRLKLEPDETIKPGGCLLLTDAGTIDATMGTAVQTVVAAAAGSAEIS